MDLGYKEYCAIVGIAENKRDELIFNAGYTWKAIEIKTERLTIEEMAEAIRGINFDENGRGVTISKEDSIFLAGLIAEASKAKAASLARCA